MKNQKYINIVEGVSVGDVGYGIFYPYDGMLVGPYEKEYALELLGTHNKNDILTQGAVLVHFDIKQALR